MKNTLGGFNQAIAMELCLDIIDLTILRWFVDFLNTKRMLTISEKLNDETTVDYYWVKYQAVINDLPCLGITNVRVISRRFDKLVKAGLLDKKVIRNIKGCFTYFRINENRYEKILPQTIKYSQINHRIQETKKGNTIEPNCACEYITIKNDSAHVSESNMGKALSSPNPIVLNSTDKLSFLHSDLTTNKNIAAETPNTFNLENKFKEISPELVFTQSFILKATDYIKNWNLDNGFSEWLYKRNQAKKPKDMRSYFMKTFFEDDIRELYLTNLAYKLSSNDHIICSACGMKHLENLDRCPECGLDYGNRQNPAAIKDAVWRKSLPEHVLQKFNEESIKLFQNQHSLNCSPQTALKKLKVKYGYPE